MASNVAKLNLTGDALTPGAQRSWWLREALASDPGAECPPLQMNLNADVVIVGGGFTGLWTAYYLSSANPSLGIAVLEEDICGGGPSGRNGGFASGWWDELDGLVALYGCEGAVRACRAISRSIDLIGHVCATHRIDAWYAKAGYVYAATAEQHYEVCAQMVEAAREAGAPEEMQPLTAREVRARCDSPAFSGGAFMRDGASGTWSATGPARARREDSRRHPRRALRERCTRDGHNAARDGPSAASRHRHQRMGDGMAFAVAAARRLEQLHDSHRAGARTRRRDWLDRR